jgi:hypothetical protein
LISSYFVKMKWFTGSGGSSSRIDEPRLLKMEKLETSSVVAADERDEVAAATADVQVRVQDFKHLMAFCFCVGPTSIKMLAY